MPLRTKLISAVLVLVAFALVVISTAGLLILRKDLIAPYDATLQSPQFVQQASGAVAHYLDRGQTYTAPGEAVDWISGGRVHRVVLPVTGLSQGNAGGFTQPNQQPMPGPSIPSNGSWLADNSGHILTVGAVSGGGRWRVLLTPASAGTVTGTIVLAVDVTNVYTTIGQLAYIDLLASLAVICVLGILVVALIRRSLRPLIDIEQTAGAIAAGDLSRRVPERDPRTEVGRLGRSLNVMLSHIEAAFQARSTSEKAARRSEDKMRQFVADASHELRTPLTAIRGFAEYYRQRGGIVPGDNGSSRLRPADMDRIMRRVEQESGRMGILVEDMLLLARLDQQRPLQANPVDLLTLAADAVHDARVVAPDRSIHLTVSSGAALIVNGDEVRLRQVIGNLMTNALTHTPAGTPIDVLIRSGTLDEAPARTPADSDNGELAAAHQPAAVLEVADHGPGLTEEQAEHVFERFYRADPARTAGGTGLGLAIVAALVAGHGGATWVRSTPGEGATFCIALPLTPEAAHPYGDEDHGDQADLGEGEGDARAA
jgi:two-component system, OmpR family, sensor kinase